MSDVSLKLTAFEGPLDLLMHLIESNKIDIYDIPIVEITEQYIGYLRNLQEFDMELASEFLVMAATLLQIKSRMLLPKEAREDEDEGEDPRQQLVEMLVEYRRIKKAAQNLRYLKEEADRYASREPMFANLVERYVPSYPVRDLLLALANVLRETGGRPLAYIEPQAFSVQEKMAEILQRLQGSAQDVRQQMPESSPEPGLPEEQGQESVPSPPDLEPELEQSGELGQEPSALRQEPLRLPSELPC